MAGRAPEAIHLSVRQKAILERFVRAETSPQRLVRRAKVILALAECRYNQEAGDRVGVSRISACEWRKRWLKERERLGEIESKNQDDKALQRAMEGVLSDAPGRGAKPGFSAEQACQIVALACESPKESGRSCTHWTQRELADEAIKRNIVPSISSRQVGRFLKEGDIKPHLSRYWLNPVIKDWDAFKHKATEICDLYLRAPDLLRQGIHVVSTDEMTGVQALERIHPTKTVKPGLVERREFEYARHGTQCLIANWHVAWGKVIAPTVGPTRKEEDFAKHIRQTVTLDPKAVWVFVADNLNTHCSETLVKVVAELCGLQEDLGEKGESGVLATMESRAAFLMNPAHRIRFVYTPKHCSWLNQVEIWFSILVRRLLKRGNFTSVEDLRQQILAFIDYFNKTMAKPFKWTCDGKALVA